MKQGKNARGRLLVAMVIFGTIGVFVRSVPLTSGEVALYRAVFAAVFLGVVLFMTKQGLPLKKMKKELPLLLLSGAALGFNWICLFEAYKYTTVSAATLSYYFAPVLVTLACPFLFHEKLGAKQWLCFAMSTLGIVLITGIGDTEKSDTHFVGILFGLGAAILYAAVVLLNKLLKNVQGLHRTMLQFAAAAFVLLPYVGFTSGFHLETLDARGWSSLLVLGLVHTGIAYCLYFSSLKELPGQKVAILSYLDPLVAVAMSVTVLGEAMTPWQIAGGVLILGFTLWNELSPKKDGVNSVKRF